MFSVKVAYLGPDYGFRNRGLFRAFGQQTAKTNTGARHSSMANCPCLGVGGGSGFNASVALKPLARSLCFPASSLVLGLQA